MKELFATNFGEFEFLVYIVIILTIALVVFNLYSLIKLIINFIKKKRGTEPKVDKYRIVRIFHRYKFFVINIAILGGIIFCLNQMFFPSPKVISTYPASNGFWTDYDKPVRIEFSRPVRKDFLETYISTNVEGKWEFVDIFSWMQLSRIVEFYPKQTFDPNELIKVYIVNFDQRDIGEYPFNFRTAKLPQIKTVSPSDKTVNVSSDTKITVDLTSEDGEFVDWEFKLTPQTEIQANRVSDFKYEIIPNEKLKQTTKYTLEIFQASKRYEVATKEVLDMSYKQKIHETTFETVKAPLIESFAPQGTGVMPDAQVKIVFDEGMDQNLVEDHFSIEPKVEGVFTWENEKTLIFKPAAVLNKETKYKVKITSGLKSASGGTTESDIEFEFETVGTVKVLSFSPANGAGGIDPATSISIVFDQDVDRPSAQSKFAMTPAVAGNFSWNGRTMIYKPTGLAYATKYTVTIQPGVKTLHGSDSTQAFSTSFTTRSSTVLLNVFHIYQQHSFGCNATATAMALNFKGAPTSEANVYNGAGSGPQPNRCSGYGCTGGGNPHLGWVPNYGVYWGPIVSYIQSRGRTAELHQGWSLTGALQEVQKGNPVIIWWQNGSSSPTNISYTAGNGQYIHAVNGMHSVLLIGYQGTPEAPTLIYYHDPYYGANRTLSPSAFDSRWATWRMGSVPAGYSRVGVTVK